MSGATRSRRGAWWALAGAVVLALVGVAIVVWLNVRGETAIEAGGPPAPASAESLRRGAYLARAGNCMGCHTATGGPAFAGGRGVETPFGVVVAPNITPDVRTGIGSWSPSEFWRAMHHGRSKDGRLLYPAFPYPSFTLVTREDADALHAFLRSVPAVDRPNEPHRLRFPYSTQAALAVWRALYFRAREFEPDVSSGADWNRGKYLVQGLGHCAACHSARNFLGGTGLNEEFAGGLMPDAGWYAPSLASPNEAGVQQWPLEDVIELLKNGVTGHASVSGPMAEVVFASTQYLSEKDLDAMSLYLASIRVRQDEQPEVRRADPAVMASGEQIYARDCAGCHGDQGQGVANVYPALAGNRAVTILSPNNVVQTIRHGGFSPTTAGNRQPFGMPPYGHALNADEMAAVATYLRQSWGHLAPPVSALDVSQVK